MLVLAVSLCLLGVASATDCVDADPMPDFTYDIFEGIWYDVAKIQTPIGSLSVRRCYCNWLDATLQNETNGDTDLGLGCNLDNATGELSYLTGELRGMEDPGRWLAYTIREIATNPIAMTIILLNEDYGITYDCGTAGRTEEYCIHFVSRTRTIPSDVLAELVTYAESLGLNPRGIELDYIVQDGCPPIEFL